jgi:hypothetical protein
MERVDLAPAFVRPGMTLPVEVYTDKRLAEFARNNEEALAAYRLKP